MNPATRRLTECSMLTALAVILHVSTIVPGLNFLTILLCPLPATYIALMYGARWVFVSTAAATVLITSVVGLGEALIYASAFAAAGAALGLLVRAGRSPGAILGLGTVAVLLATLISAYGLERVMGLDDTAKSLLDMRAQATWLRSLVDGGPNPAFDAWIERVMTVPLALFAALSFLVVYANFLVAAVLFPRLSVPFEDLPDPRAMLLPPWLGLPLLGLALMPDPNLSSPWALSALVNLSLAARFTLLVAGLSLLVSALDRWRVPPPLRLVLLFLAFAPVLNTVTLVAATADSLADLRRLRR